MDYTLDDGVAIIRFDDGKANVVSPAFSAGMDECLDRAEAEGAGAVLLVGREGMFSAGFDLKEFEKGVEAGMAMVHEGIKLAVRLYSLPLPLVAACTGHGIAMGAFLLLACDTRVGARGDYRLTLPETRINMDIPTVLVTLTRSQVPANYLTRVAIQSEIFSPDDSVAAGFLDEVVEPGEVFERALAHAKAFAQMPQKNYTANKLYARKPALETMRAELAEILGGS